MENILNNQQKIILGMAIGDGYITKNNTLIIQHSEKQLDYLQYKKEVLEKNQIYSCNIYKINNNNFIAYRIETKRYFFIKKVRNLLYTPNKNISLEVLQNLLPETIGYWYLDDGGLSQKYKNGKLSCNELMLNTGLTKDQNQIIINYFKDKWDINFSQCKNHNCYRLRCGTKEARKLMDIIYPHVCKIESLSYKLNIKDYQYIM